MSNNIDAKYNTLGLFNYVGVQEDRELQFYNSYGITSTNIRDAENEFLGLFGYASGSVTDRWDGFLRSRGFTGSVDDMLVKFWELATASLDLNFVNNNYASSSLVNTPFKNKAFNDAITFSRGTNATYVDSLGNIAYAPSNLLTYSEQFDNAAWAKTNSSIAANTVPSPDGTATADKLIEASDTNLVHQTAETGVAVVSLATYTASCYVKADTRTRVRIAFIVAGGGVIADADLSTSTISAPSTFGGGTAISSSIQPLNNGWFRISVVGSGPAGTSGECRLELLNASGNRQYNGDGVSGLYIWGAQLNLGTLQPYNSTTVENLLGYTQDFDNAAWTKSNSSITENVITAPDGSLTADKLVPTTATSTHYVFQSVSSTVGTTYTYSTYLKQGEYRYGRIERGNDGAGAFFDLQTGTVGGTNGLIVSSAITSVGNGWYRCSIVVVAATPSMFFVVVSGNNVADIATFTGDGTSGIYLWGAQLSDSASLDPYSYNFTTAPTAAAYYGPRFDYDPVTLACKGLLIEEQRTNLFLQNTDFDSISWTKLRSSITANATVSPDGTLTGDKLIASTDVNTSHFVRQDLSVTSGATYTQTIYAKAAEYTQIYMGFDGDNATFAGGSVIFTLTGSGTAGVPVGSLTSFSITSVRNGWYRCQISATATATATAVFRIQSATGGTNSFTGDGVSGVFIWGAQLELGAFATSVIPTTTTAVTRAADVAVIQGANFSNWYNPVEGTLYTESQQLAVRTAFAFPFIVAIDDGSSNNAILHLWRTDTSRLYATANSGGANQYDLGVNGVTQTNVNRIASAFAVNNFAASVNGSTVLTDLSGVVPSGLATLRIGKSNGADYLSGHIARILFWPSRLSNTDLQKVTT